MSVPFDYLTPTYVYRQVGRDLRYKSRRSDPENFYLRVYTLYGDTVISGLTMRPSQVRINSSSDTDSYSLGVSGTTPV